ncbi:mucin-4-like [Schistocerca cancellata]|uniref:mucin-4-like n=1 Tax=Schistocerca cancellata TaxID=274614 RepID=UPI0021189FD2|nr:mucin-4-like [Schistocerca cancellata]
MRKPPQWKSYKKLEEDIESTEQATGVEAQPPAATTSGKGSSSTVTQPPPPSPITDSSSESSQLSYETAFVDASGNTPASADNSKGERVQAWYETKCISQDEQSPVESKGSDPPRTTEHNTPALADSDGVQLVSATVSQPITKEASVHVRTNGEGTKLGPMPIGASQEGTEAVPAPKPIGTSGEGTKPVRAHIGTSGEGAEVVSAPAPSGTIEDEAKPAPAPVCIGASGQQEETVPVPMHVKVREERAKSVPLPITFEAVGEGAEPVSLPMSVGAIGEGAEPVTAPMPITASAGGAEPTLILHEAGPTRTWVRGMMSTLLQVVRAARPSVPASAPDSPADSVAAGVRLRVAPAPSVGRRPITPYSTAREVLEEVQRQHGIFRSALLRHANRLWLEVRGRPETEVVPAAALDAKEALLSRFRDTLSHVDVELREAQRQMERRADYVAALGGSAWSGRPPCLTTQVGGGAGLDLAEGLQLQPAFSPPRQQDVRDAGEHSCGRFFRVLCSCFICIPRRQ